MRKLLIFINIPLMIFIIQCSKPLEPESTTAPTQTWIPIPFNPDEIEIDGDLKSFVAAWEKDEVEENLQVLTLILRSPRPAVPPRFSIKWSFPSVDIHGIWNTNLNMDKVNFWGNRVTSKATNEAPVMAFIDNSDLNRFTFACSDALNQLKLRSDIREENAQLYCSVEFFGEKTPALTEYRVQIRIDRRKIPYYTALREVSEWWAAQENYTPAPVPDSARKPMYSTWYSFHQNISADEVVSECRLAKELGFEAVIVDDGWQTLDNSRGYAYTGDWKPERIPDMESFVDRVHQLGMKFLLWYSVPFIGEKAKNYQKFIGKYLRYWKSQGAYVLDPRYPEVREFIIQTYIKALKDWNLDGFKLDFMGFFTAVEDTAMTKAQGRDYASVNEAVDRLMTDIMIRLRELNSAIMIEFRQRYIGPLMRKYGNMFRAADCPNMAVINRVRTTDIRLLCGKTAAHSDMYMWHRDDPVEAAAQQILNVLFSVPQLSVRLDSVPEEHTQMIKFWTEYWKQNRLVLLDGEFIPVNPGALYPLIKAETDDKAIIAVYNDMFITLDPKNQSLWDVVNAKSSETVILDFVESLGEVEAEIYNCQGNLVSGDKIRLNKGIFKISIPPSGLLKISRLK